MLSYVNYHCLGVKIAEQLTLDETVQKNEVTRLHSRTETLRDQLLSQ